METTCSECTQESSKVHFPEEQVEKHNSEIVTQAESESRITVHLGFLQILHRYEIRFSVKDTFSEDLDSNPLQNLHCKVVDVRPSEDGEGHDIVLDFCAYKEKLLKEELTLMERGQGGRSLTLVLQARVLGKGKGTPSLRSGIHCTGIDADDDSEYSDWQGY